MSHRSVVYYRFKRAGDDPSMTLQAALSSCLGKLTHPKDTQICYSAGNGKMLEVRHRQINDQNVRMQAVESVPKKNASDCGELLISYNHCIIMPGIKGGLASTSILGGFYIGALLSKAKKECPSLPADIDAFEQAPLWSKKFKMSGKPVQEIIVASLDGITDHETAWKKMEAWLAELIEEGRI